MKIARYDVFPPLNMYRPRRFDKLIMQISGIAAFLAPRYEEKRRRRTARSFPARDFSPRRKTREETKVERGAGGGGGERKQKERGVVFFSGEREDDSYKHYSPNIYPPTIFFSSLRHTRRWLARIAAMM